MERLCTGTYCCALLILLIGSFPSLVGSTPDSEEGGTKAPPVLTKTPSLPGRSLGLEKGAQNGPLVLTATAFSTSRLIRTKMDSSIDEVVDAFKIEPKVTARVFTLTATSPAEPAAGGEIFTLLVQMREKATDIASEYEMKTLITEQRKAEGEEGKTGWTFIYVSDGKSELEALLTTTPFSKVKVAPVRVVTAFYNVRAAGVKGFIEEIEHAKNEMVRIQILESEVAQRTRYLNTRFEEQKVRISVGYWYKGKKEPTKDGLQKKVEEIWKHIQIGNSVEFSAFDDEMRIVVVVMDIEFIVRSDLARGQHVPYILRIPLQELSSTRYSNPNSYLHATTVHDFNPIAHFTPVTDPLFLTCTAFVTPPDLQKLLKDTIHKVLDTFEKKPEDTAEVFSLLAADGKTYTLLVQLRQRAPRGSAAAASEKKLTTLISEQWKVEGYWQTWIYGRNGKSEFEAWLRAPRFSQVQVPAVQVGTASYKVDDTVNIDWGEEIEQTKKELVDTHLTSKVETPLSNVVKGAAAGKEIEPKKTTSFKNGVHFMDFKEQNGKVLVSFKYTGTEDLTEEQMSEKANELWKHIPIGKSVETVAYNEEMRIVVMVMQLNVHLPDWFYGKYTSIPPILKIGVEETCLNRYSDFYLQPTPKLRSKFKTWIPFAVPAVPVPMPYQVSHRGDPVYIMPSDFIPHGAVVLPPSAKMPSNSNPHPAPPANPWQFQHFNTPQTPSLPNIKFILDPESQQQLLHITHPPDKTNPKHYIHNYYTFDEKTNHWVPYAGPLPEDIRP